MWEGNQPWADSLSYGPACIPLPLQPHRTLSLPESRPDGLSCQQGLPRCQRASSPVPAPLVSACSLDPHPVGAGQPEAWCSGPRGASCPLYDLIKCFHSSTFFSILNCLPHLNSTSLPRPSVTFLPPHESLSNLSPATMRKRFCLPCTCLAVCTCRACITPAACSIYH